MNVPRVEELAAMALREWLLRQLPSVCDTINALRAATLVCPLVGPYTLPDGATPGLADVVVSTVRGTVATHQVTSGSRTAAQVATDLNAAATFSPTMTASADSMGRLVIANKTAPSAVSADTPSVLWTQCASALNTALGWADEEFQVRMPLVPPSPENVLDGMPVAVSDLRGRGFAVVLGNRASKRVEPLRRHEFETTLDLGIFALARSGEGHKSRDFIHGAVRAVRACIAGVDGGRQLGRASFGDVMLVDFGGAKVGAKPYSFSSSTPTSPQPLYDVAQMLVTVRTYEAQSI